MIGFKKLRRRQGRWTFQWMYGNVQVRWQEGFLTVIFSCVFENEKMPKDRRRRVLVPLFEEQF